MKTAVGGSGEAAAFFIACIGLSFAVWPIAFNYGAYQTVFMDHLFQVWAASIAALIASLFIGVGAVFRQTGWRVAVRLFLFAMPSAWLICEVFFFATDNPAAVFLISALTLATMFLALPYIGYVIFSVLVPQAGELRSLRFYIGLIVVALVLASVGWTAGHFNDYLISCWEFKVAGHHEPDGCWTPPADLDPRGDAG